MATATLTFYGESGTHAMDGFAGFRIGQTYALTYSEEDDEVLV